MRTWILALTLGVATGCSGTDPVDSGNAGDTDTSDTDTSDTDTSDTDTDTTCADVEPAACEDAAGCRTIAGRVVSDSDCMDYSQIPTAFGCMSEDLGCGDAETWARPGEGEACVLFMDTCIPDGWTACDFQDVQECV